MTGSAEEKKDGDSKEEIIENLRKFFAKDMRSGYAGTVTAGVTPILAASDHLPVMWQDESTGVKVLSWNMLSDTHLYNNFLNVANIDAFKKSLESDEFLKDNYYAKNLKTFFYELSEFARLEQGLDKDITEFKYSPERFQEFIASGFFHPTSLSDEQYLERMSARQELAYWFLDLPEPVRGAAEGLSSKDFATSM